MLPNRAQDRRLFLQAAASLAAGAAASHLAEPASAQETKSAADKIVVGVMGVNGRGSALANSFLAQPNVEIAYVADVDTRAVDKAVALIAGKQQAPKGVGDFRKILDDKAVDVLVIAAPNHWHAPAAILGASAGKHVYVEKPCSYTPEEGELAVAAARKHNRVMNMGTQRRSWPGIVEGIAKVHEGAIGKPLYARTWYNNRRPSIGHGQKTSPPSWLDWTLWQGPAPEVPFKDNVVHYNWHWHWHWGNGELGNNGVHGLDVARWGLQVQYPSRVTAGGGKFRHDDDQETPDTMMVTLDFPGGKTITWEGLSWSPLGPQQGSMFGLTFHGDAGSLVMLDTGYKIYDLYNKETGEGKGRAGDVDHLANFLDCIRTGKRPNADIAEAHQSTLLCHLGNIAYRVNRVLKCDPANGHILGDPAAAALWAREYRSGWQPKV